MTEEETNQLLGECRSAIREIYLQETGLSEVPLKTKIRIGPSFSENGITVSFSEDSGSGPRTEYVLKYITGMLAGGARAASVRYQSNTTQPDAGVPECNLIIFDSAPDLARVINRLTPEQDKKIDLAKYGVGVGR